MLFNTNTILPYVHFKIDNSKKFYVYIILFLQAVL